MSLSACEDRGRFTHAQYLLGDLRRNRKVGLVRLYESEERFEFGALSCANQAAAFDQISRSTRSCRFSRRSRISSSR